MRKNHNTGKQRSWSSLAIWFDLILNFLNMNMDYLDAEKHNLIFTIWQLFVDEFPDCLDKQTYLQATHLTIPSYAQFP